MLPLSVCEITLGDSPQILSRWVVSLFLLARRGLDPSGLSNLLRVLYLRNRLVSCSPRSLRNRLLCRLVDPVNRGCLPLSHPVNRGCLPLSLSSPSLLFLSNLFHNSPSFLSSPSLLFRVSRVLSKAPLILPSLRRCLFKL